MTRVNTMYCISTHAFSRKTSKPVKPTRETESKIRSSLDNINAFVQDSNHMQFVPAKLHSVYLLRRFYKFKTNAIGTACRSVQT